METDCMGRKLYDKKEIDAIIISILSPYNDINLEDTWKILLKIGLLDIVIDFDTDKVINDRWTIPTDEARSFIKDRQEYVKYAIEQSIQSNNRHFESGRA